MGLARGGHPVRADFSFENGENRVIPRDRYMSLDTQNTKNHHQSIYLTRVVLRLRSELFCIGSTARSQASKNGSEQKVPKRRPTPT